MVLCTSFSYITIAGEKQKPNIIFFITDDMSPEMFNYLNLAKETMLTPNIDNLANTGTIIRNQYVASTVCTPSRFNCLTGKYASRARNEGFQKQCKKNNGQRVVEWNTHILPNDFNLAKRLNEGGYFTGAVGKNHVFEVSNYVEVPLSADVKDEKVMEQQLSNYKNTQQAYYDIGFDYAEGLFYENPLFNGPKELAVHNLDWSTEKALDFLDEASNKDVPFFLYFATTVPHGPTGAISSWDADRTITPIGKLEKAPNCLPDKSTIPIRLLKSGLKNSEKECNVLWVDDAVGALLDKLRANGQLDNTIIFFFNDHGYPAKGTLYQAGVETQSIVWKNDGFKVGNVCDYTVSNIDFTPTILDLAGVDYSDEDIDGKSFRYALDGKKLKERKSIYFEIGNSRGVKMGNYKYIALRYPEWVEALSIEDRKEILEKYNKKISTRGKNPNNLDPAAPWGHVQIIPGGGDAEYKATKMYPNYTDVDQLYDLSKDPKEQVNLYNDPSYKKVVDKMRSELQKYCQSIGGGFGEFQ